MAHRILETPDHREDKEILTNLALVASSEGDIFQHHNLECFLRQFAHSVPLQSEHIEETRHRILDSYEVAFKHYDIRQKLSYVHRSISVFYHFKFA